MLSKGQTRRCSGAPDPFSLLQRKARLGRTFRTFVLVRAQTDLPPKLLRARKVRQLGLASSTAILSTGIAFLVTSNARLPKVSDGVRQLPATLAAASIILALALAAYKAQREGLEVEWHNGALYLQWNLPPEDGPNLEEGAILVRPAGQKGNGAFAAKTIAKWTYLGDYEGELLDESAYWKRYPTGVADYCMGIDRQWTLDGRDRAEITSKFSPVHMNHSSTQQNVTRRCSRAERRVSFYAARDIQTNEELLLDYGKTYWTGREDAIVE